MRLLLALLLVCLAPAWIRADVVYNNLAGGAFLETDAQDLDHPTRIGFAQQFVTSGAFNDLGVKINLFKSGSTTGTFSVRLLDNSGSVPTGSGILLGTGNWNDLTTSHTNQFSLSATFAEKAQGTYWLVVIDNNPSLSHRWAFGQTRPYTSPVSGTEMGVAMYNSITNSWTNLGTSFPLGAQIATPEPGTMVLGSIAALSAGAGYFWNRRRRTNPESAPVENPEEGSNTLAV